MVLLAQGRRDCLRDPLYSPIRYVHFRYDGGADEEKKRLSGSQFASPTYARSADPASLAQFTPRSLSEKPLPIPPIARVTTASPIKETRCLIDAREKPLRRSPPGLPHKQEEWPVLSPMKLTVVGHDSVELPSRDALSAPTGALSIPASNDQMYSTLSPVPATGSGVEHLGVGKSSQTWDIHRKPIFTEARSLKSHPKEVIHKKSSDTIKYVVAADSSSSENHFDPSFSIVKAEKRGKEPVTLGQPRQTRTSSLRARLSATKLAKESSGPRPKVVAFKESSAANEIYSMPVKDGYYITEDAQIRSPSAPSCRKKPSAGFIRVNHPQAQFVGGNQWTSAHRPSSVNSVRSNSQSASPSLTSQQANRAVPMASPISQDPPIALKTEVAQNTERRRSSIPIFCHTASRIVSQAESRIISAESMGADDAPHDEQFHNQVEILESSARGPLLEVPDEVIEVVQSEHLNNLSNPHDFARNLPSLRAVQESPRQGYQIKRLSIVSPENGPTLKIFPSADRLIMGVESGTEKQLSRNTLKLNDHRTRLGRTTSEATASGRGSSLVLKRRLERPASSHDLRHSVSRISLLTSGSDDRRVKSGELSYSLSTNHLRPQSGMSNTSIRKCFEKSMADDPFLDIQTAQQSNHVDVPSFVTPETAATDNGVELSVDEESWISPKAKKHRHDLNGRLSSLCSDLPRATHQEVVIGASSKCCELSKTVESGQNIAVVSQTPSEQCSNRAEKPPDIFASTPPRPLVQAGNTYSSAFPPRRSSRTTPPDYTINRLSQRTPTSPSKVVRCAQSEFLSRQNQLGASKGVASSPLDISQAVVYKRDSIARNSNKSQVSTSRGMLSNIRGLFHKRPSEHDPSPIKSNGKGKQATCIAPNGSPFLPISEIHPIHRPTLASANRSALLKGRKNLALDSATISPGTPSFASPLPSEISTTTTLAMQLLESARTERSSPRKEQALELGSILVEAITQARDAEKAMEEAKQAARRAEVSHALCKKSVGDIAKKVLEWRDEVRG